MVNLKYLLSRIRDVKLKDVLSVFPMGLALVISPLYKKKYSNTWLICEEKKEARDNGYWFYKKMVENHPEQPCIYAIDKKSVDYSKIKELGNVIQYGSLQHWIIYFTCKYNISSQKGGKPNAALCALIELNNLYNAHNIFLQHGVIINNLKWLYADVSRFEMFITSAIPEKKFIEKYFGYPKGTIKLTGLPRFDNLHQNRTNLKRIVIMPTWRYWFNLKSKQQKNLDRDFKTSEYLEKWKEFLECERLNGLIEKYGLEIIFYPHRNLQHHLPEIRKAIKTKAIIASWKEYELQELLITSAMMITDYSSVFFDMVYMHKPIMFYQFDLERFRKGQYEKGYFDYSNNPFGKSYSKLEDLMSDFLTLISKNFQCSDEFLEGHKKYFPYYDTHNSERVFEEIKKMEMKVC